jgi:hypothetical protein
LSNINVSITLPVSSETRGYSTIQKVSLDPTKLQPTRVGLGLDDPNKVLPILLDAINAAAAETRAAFNEAMAKNFDAPTLEIISTIIDENPRTWMDVLYTDATLAWTGSTLANDPRTNPNYANGFKQAIESLS